MENIEQLRMRINEIDEKILGLLKKRARICKAIGSMKKKQGIPIHDVHRENDVFMHAKERAEDFGLNPLHLEAIFRQIVNMCSEVQN